MMRITETTYRVVGENGSSYEVKMKRIKGLRIRELVPVRVAKAPKAPCSSENTRTR